MDVIFDMQSTYSYLFVFFFSFKASTAMGGNSCHQRWIQGAEAVWLQREICCLFLLSTGLVSNILNKSWQCHFIKVVGGTTPAVHTLMWVFLCVRQHIRLSHRDHCIRRSCARVPCHQHWGDRLFCGLTVYASGLVRLLSHYSNKVLWESHQY